ncbi:MAG: sulfotransferase family protein [Myxococcota bacterium]
MAVPMIICGHPRSGTTMLTRLCNTHPEARVTFEFRSFRRLDVPAAEHLQAIRTDWRERRILAKRHARWGGGLFLQRYRWAIRRSGEQPISAGVVSDVLSDLFPHAKVVGDKFPDYVFDLDQLCEIEGLRRLVIVRDPRDVARSAMQMSQTSWKGQDFTDEMDTPEKVAARWVRSIETIERNRDRIFALRYEHFVADPSAALDQIGEWLGIDPAGFERQRVHGASAGRYRDGLSPDEIDRILRVAGPTMERLGYA